MISSIIFGIIFVTLGLIPIFTSLSLWWLLLGVPLILIGLIFFLYVITLRRCYNRFLLGEDEEALKKLRDEVNKKLNKR